MEGLGFESIDLDGLGIGWFDEVCLVDLDGLAIWLLEDLDGWLLGLEGIVVEVADGVIGIENDRGLVFFVFVEVGVIMSALFL